MCMFKKIKNFILGDSSSEVLTNESLTNLIVESFKDGIDKLKINNTLLYPTYFTIYLHKNNFNVMKPSFPFIVECCAEKFVGILRKKMKGEWHWFRRISYKLKKPRQNWLFQFTECDENTPIRGTENRVAINEPVFEFVLVPEAVGGGSGGSKSCVGTLHKRGSKLADHFAIDEDALAVTYLGGDAYEIAIDLDTVDFKGKAKKVDSKKKDVIATLTISGVTFVGGGKIVEIREPKAKICGRTGSSVKATGTDEDVILIDDNKVLNYHFIIEHIAEKFKITAKGNTRLNRVKLKIDERYDLPANSDIVIDDRINLRFNPR